MQVQLTMQFDPTEQQDLVNRLERILHAAGNETVVPASGTKSPSDTAPDKDTGPDALKAQRQQQAANARAAKVAKQQTQPTGPRVSGGIAQTPVDDVSGTNDTGNGLDNDSDDLGLDTPGMSPGEAKDAALALVREVYSSGHVAEVKALQKELNVAKFYDVDVAKGHTFYQRVMKLAQGVGIRQ